MTHLQRARQRIVEQACVRGCQPIQTARDKVWNFADFSVWIMIWVEVVPNVGRGNLELCSIIGIHQEVTGWRTLSPVQLSTST